MLNFSICTDSILDKLKENVASDYSELLQSDLLYLSVFPLVKMFHLKLIYFLKLEP